MTFLEYDDFMEEQYLKIERDLQFDDEASALIGDQSHHEDNLPLEGEEGTSLELEQRLENELCDEFMALEKKDLHQTTFNEGQRTGFEFEKVSQDVSNFDAIVKHDEFTKMRNTGQTYVEDDVDRLDERTLDNFNAAFPTDKEVDEEFEDLWQGVTSDYY